MLLKCTKKSFSYDVYKWFDRVLDGGSPIKNNMVNNKKCPFCQQHVFPNNICDKIPISRDNYISMCSTCATICGVDIWILTKFTFNSGKPTLFTTRAYVNNERVDDKYLICQCISKSEELCSRYFHDAIIMFIMKINTMIPNEITFHILRFIY